MEDGGTGGRRAQEDVKKEEALVRGSEEEPTKKTPPPSHFKPAGTIEFRIGADTLPCGGAENDTGHRAAGAGLHPVLEVLADPGLVAQVVMGVEAALQSSPGCPIPREADFLEPKGEQVAEWPGQG